MEDGFSFLIYVAVAVLYFLFSLAGSKKKKSTDESQRPAPKVQTSTMQNQKDASFDDYMKNLTKNLQQTKSTEIESHSLEKVETGYQSYESTKSELGTSLEKVYADESQSLEDVTYKSENEVLDFKAAKEFGQFAKSKIISKAKREKEEKDLLKISQAKPATKSFRNFLKDRDNLKNAFIMSEVFKPKY